MAEVLAGWLASAVVRIAKDKLASVIAQPVNLLWNFGDDLEDMVAVLESISAALQDAERRSARERLVQLWLKRLKNVALDISDMLEDYQDNSADHLTAKIPRVLTCVPMARKKIDMANSIKSLREDLRKINEEFRNFHFTPGTIGTYAELHNDCRETSSLSPEEPIGRNGEKQEILNLLSAGTNNDGTVIVAIYGFGGIGKTTLAQLLYNDDQFKKRYDHTVWVYVSQDFNLKKIGSFIISQLPIGGGQQNRDTLHVINQCLDNLLPGKKVLIVLDDLWEENETELRKLRSMLHVGKKESMINVIVTTRKQDIATKVSTIKPYKLQPLKDETCWEIIKRSSKFEHKHNKERLETIGLDIAKKCGGVPLAAQTLGYMLQSKEMPGWLEINKSNIWNESSEDNDDVLPSLKLSYERMPPQLRICFSYCAIFPKGHSIAEDDLIHQWIALDFIKPSKGLDYIRQLLGMSFLQVSKFPKASSQEHITLYTMHDLVHDLASLTLSDELIISFVASKSNTTYGHKYCRYALVKKYDQTMKLSNIFPSKIRALHFSDSGKLDLISGSFKFAKCLRILDFSGCSSILLPASIGLLKQLRYLVAPRIQNEVLPDYITKLSKLQYLNLNGSAHISALPKSIGKLAECLKYLILSGCSGISKLPESFSDLICLVHLDMSSCSGIRKLPDSIGNLTNLQHLMLSKCTGLEALPESMSGLVQLQYLNLSKCSYIARLPEAIGRLVNLEYLNMSYCGFRELPDSFKLLHNLQHLNLEKSTVVKGLPGALSGLTALQYLEMSSFMADNLEKDDLPVAMRNLINLKVLNLADSLYGLFGVENNDGYLDFIGSLTNLESLDLSLNAQFLYLPESIGNLKRLNTLNLMLCEGLMSIPESIRCATGLKSMRLRGCSDELIDQATSLLHYSLTLPLFKVIADGTSDRSNLHQLAGEKVDELHISCLENVRSLEEARGLNLLTKEHLLELSLEWTIGAGQHHLEHKDLLGQLVPPKSLLSLAVQGYSSPSFPSWLMDISHHLLNITNISLSHLAQCTSLPPLGQLPYLERLWLSHAPNIQKIDSGICGGKSAFPRLAHFTVYHMETLEEWDTMLRGEDGTGAEEFMFPVLDVFQVINCPRMRLKPRPPKCRECMIAVSDQVISSLLVEVETSSRRHSSSSQTTSLIIIGSQCNGLRLFHHFPALQELVLSTCPNLTFLPEGIRRLSSLKSLELSKCDSISALPYWLSDISSLKRLLIIGCNSIKSLPPCIRLLTSLQNLDIHGNLELQQWCESEENKANLAHIDNINYGY